MSAKCKNDLAETLLRDGVSRAHLMPTLDNEAAVVNERWASLAGA